MTRLDAVDPIVERVPVVMVLDTSSGMQQQIRTGEGERRPRLELLNEGLHEFGRCLERTEHRCIDLGVVSFGSGVTVEQSFIPVEEWNPSTLQSAGHAPLGEAVERGIDLIEARKAEYNQEGLPYKKPILGLLTNSLPTDMSEDDSTWDRVERLLDVGTSDDHFALIAGGASDEAVDILCTLTASVDTSVLQVVTAEEGHRGYFRLLADLAESVRVHRRATGGMFREHAIRVDQEYNGLHRVE